MNRKRMKHLPSGKFVLQMAMILWFCNAFIVSALLSNSTSKAGIKWIAFDCGVLLFLDILCVVLWKLAPERPAVASYLNPKTWGKRIRENWQITTALVLGFLQRFWMMNNLQRWDAGEYYYRLGTGCQNFDFSLIGFLKCFRLCLHPTYGLSLIMAPGEFLNPRGGVGVMVINLFFTLVAMYCLYEMFRFYFCRLSKAKAAFGAFLCLSTPLLWGTFGYFNPDYCIAIFLVLFMHAEYKENYLSMFFWGFCVSQCKETGIVIVFGYAVARVIAIWISHKGITQKIKNEWKSKANWANLCVGLTYVVYAIGNGGMSAWKAANSETVTSFMWDNNGANCFGFNLRRVYEIFMQIFVLNYSWIIWLLIVACVLFLLIKGKKRECGIQFENTAGLLGAGTIYLMFTTLYITYTIYRYQEFWLLGTVMLLVIFGFEATKNWKKQWVILPAAVLTLLLGYETFHASDPVGKCFVRTASTGTEPMLFSSGGSEYYGDYLVSNYQYTWIDDAMDGALREAEMDEHTMAILTHINDWDLHINGNGPFYHVKWDPEKQVRTMREEGTIEITTIPSKGTDGDVVYTYAVLNKEGIVKDKAILMFFPYYEEDEQLFLDQFSEYYTISDRKEYQNWGGKVAYYTMDLLPKYGGGTREN